MFCLVFTRLFKYIIQNRKQTSIIAGWLRRGSRTHLPWGGGGIKCKVSKSDKKQCKYYKLISNK